MTQEAYKWVPLPERSKFIPILSVKVGQPLVCFPVGPILGAPAHFLDGQSVPCSALWGAECRWCKILPPRWKGFLPVLTRSRSKRIVEITAKCAENHPSLSDPSAKRWWWEFYRQGPNRNSPLIAVRQTQYEPLPNAEAFDPEPSVLNMWKLGFPPIANDVHQGEG